MHIPLIEIHQDKLNELCEQYGVDKLYVFGSVLTNRFNDDTSDIDLIVELQPMSPIDKGETLLNLSAAMEELFQRKVDLLSDQPTQNPILKQKINSSKMLIYDRRSQKIPA